MVSSVRKMSRVWGAALVPATKRGLREGGRAIVIECNKVLGVS